MSIEEHLELRLHVHGGGTEARTTVHRLKRASA